MGSGSTAFIKHLHRPNHRTAILGSAVLLLGLVSFSLLYIAATQHSGAPTTIDQSTLHWMIDHRDSRRTSLAVAFTHMLSPIVMLVLTAAIAGVWFFTRNEKWRPALLLGGVGTGYLAVIILKDSVARIRPPLESMIAPLDTSFSFPSMHTAGVALCALLVGYLLYSRQPSKRNLLLWIDTALFSIIIVATTRLFLGYHWLTDVSASVGLALIVLGLVIIIDGCYIKK